MSAISEFKRLPRNLNASQKDLWWNIFLKIGTVGGGGGGGPVAVAPVNTVAPVLSDSSPEVGDVLTASEGTWTGTPTSFTWLWYRDGVSLGVTTETRVVVSADIGHVLRRDSVAHNAAGDSSAVASNTSDTILASDGDILSVAILPSGWEADVEIRGLNTGGSYDFGLGANNDPATGTPKITFTVVSLGFDDTGAATTITRTVYGTHEVRKPYPDYADNQGSNDGTNTTVRIALSDYIYTKDNTGGGNSGTAPVVNILSGFYTKSTVPNNASGAFAVTNSSACAYQPGTAYSSRANFQLVEGDFDFGVVGMHGDAKDGSPFACVKVTVADAHGHSVSYFVTALSLDVPQGDALPVPEYVAHVNVSTLTALDDLTIDYQCYPWVGDSGAVVDTTDGVNSNTSGLYCTQTYVNDKSQTFGRTLAVVDPLGSDTTGAVVDRESYGSEALAAAAAAATPFLTVGKAAREISLYNNSNHSRGNADGGIICCKAGTYESGAGYNIIQTTPSRTWLVVKTYTGVSRADVIFGNVGSGYDQNLGADTRVKWEGVKYTGSSNITWGSSTFLWLDGCELDYTAGHLSYNVNTFYTRNLVTNSTDGGICPTSGSVNPLLQRGNTINGSDAFPVPFCCVGNQWNGVPGSFEDSPANKNGILFICNKVMAYSEASTSILRLFGTASSVTRCAIVQNLFEFVSGNGAMLIAADGSTGDDVNNVMIVNNTVVGGKVNLAYQDTGTTTLNRKFWRIKNNIFEDFNIKADTFTTASGNRIGNWPILFGCGCSGNLDVESVSAAGQFLPDTDGLSSYSPTRSGGQPPGSATNTTAFTKFTDYQADVAGGGIYTLTTGTPAAGLQRDWALSIDLAGAARSATDAAGAYHYP